MGDLSDPNKAKTRRRPGPITWNIVYGDCFFFQLVWATCCFPVTRTRSIKFSKKHSRNPCWQHRTVCVALRGSSNPLAHCDVLSGMLVRAWSTDRWIRTKTVDLEPFHEERICFVRPWTHTWKISKQGGTRRAQASVGEFCRVHALGGRCGDATMFLALFLRHGFHSVIESTLECELDFTFCLASVKRLPVTPPGGVHVPICYRPADVHAVFPDLPSKPGSCSWCFSMADRTGCGWTRPLSPATVNISRILHPPKKK